MKLSRKFVLINASEKGEFVVRFYYANYLMNVREYFEYFSVLREASNYFNFDVVFVACMLMNLVTKFVIDWNMRVVVE